MRSHVATASGTAGRPPELVRTRGGPRRKRPTHAHATDDFDPALQSEWCSDMPRRLRLRWGRLVHVVRLTDGEGKVLDLL
jgi:hypothetical protein